MVPRKRAGSKNAHCYPKASLQVSSQDVFVGICWGFGEMIILSAPIRKTVRLGWLKLKTQTFHAAQEELWSERWMFLQQDDAPVALAQDAKHNLCLEPRQWCS